MSDSDSSDNESFHSADEAVNDDDDIVDIPAAKVVDKNKHTTTSKIDEKSHETELSKSPPRPVSLSNQDPNQSSDPSPITTTNQEQEDDNDMDDADWSNDGWGEESGFDLVTPHIDRPLPGDDGKLVLKTPIDQLETEVEDRRPNVATSNPLDKLTEDTADSGDGWGGWGSLLSAATDSISTLKSTVDTIGMGFGIPTPEDIARMTQEEKEELERKADEVKESWPSSDHDDCDSASDTGLDSPTHGPGHTAAFTDLLTGVKSTGKTLIGGSLDVLESIGKKTFDALTVADEEQNRRRFILSQDQPSLSKVLKERKVTAEREAQNQQQENGNKQCNYAYQFEMFEGIAQLEGLELVSANCSKQVLGQQNASTDHVARVFGAAMQQTDSTSEDTDHDFGRLLQQILAELHLPYNAAKLIKAQTRRRQWITDCIAEQNTGVVKGSDEIYCEGIQSLAEITARCLESVHKLAQLLLIANEPPDSEVFVQLIDLMCTELGQISNQFAVALNTAADDSPTPESVTPLLTGLFFEANNSSNYVRQTLALLQPVVQLAVLKS